MQLYLLYSNGGNVTGDVTVMVGGEAAGNCHLPPTRGWETYKNATCLGAETPLLWHRILHSIYVNSKRSLAETTSGQT